METQPLTHEEHLELTYTADKKDYCLSDINLEQSLPLDNSRSYDDARCDLGVIDKLPLEIQQIILSSIDLQTLTDFCRVNRRARQVVDSIPEYSSIIRHSPDALHAALGIETARYFTCADLWQALTSRNCAGCGAFGSHIYLLTCKRICFKCLCREKRSLLLTSAEASRCFALDKASLEEVRSMHSIRGRYSPSRRNRLRE